MQAVKSRSHASTAGSMPLGEGAGGSARAHDSANGRVISARKNGCKAPPKRRQFAPEYRIASPRSESAPGGARSKSTRREWRRRTANRARKWTQNDVEVAGKDESMMSKLPHRRSSSGSYCLPAPIWTPKSGKRHADQQTKHVERAAWHGYSIATSQSQQHGHSMKQRSRVL